ncbi:MAG: hemin uptake protein HemP [Planctomycetia bacterium]|nr:hemin uptake protein HemP [Planctomycetia bacterium]
MSTTLEPEERDHAPASPVPTPNTAGDRISYRTEELFQGRREVWFEHGNEQYRLRITAAGKLILTK